MFTKEKQNFPTSQDFDSIYPKDEIQTAVAIKNFFKSDIPIEIIGSGSKRQIGRPLQCAKTLNLSIPGLFGMSFKYT